MDDIFINDLRKALNSLYDLNHLRQNPLCQVFTDGNPFDASLWLQHVLEDAISALKPKKGETPGSYAWETYELLSLRYLQQFSQKEVADQLGVSVSQMNRVQQKALETLAAYLWEKFKLANRVKDEGKTEQIAAETPESPAPADADLAWMAVASREKVADLGVHLQGALAIIQPFLAKYTVTLETPLLPVPIEVLVYPMALRQILLNLLAITIPLMATGRITLTIARPDKGVALHLDGHQFLGAAAVLTEDQKTNLDIAANLTRLSGGKLDFQSDENGIQVCLQLPVRASLPILVIDDNLDTLRLLQHYLADTRYRLVSTSDPQQAIPMAESSAAQAIVVDVMMPRIDGWTLLQKLHNHPVTANIPVIICSILRQEELAESLGASAYLRKPINQAEFLALLDRLTADAASGLC
jgi:CheY-like chemotaxis protein